MTGPTTDLLFTAAALLCSLLGSFHDVRTRRIPNLLTGPAFVLAIALHLLLGGWSAAGTALLAGLVAGGLTFLFFLAGGMGAGDVKLLAVVGCFVGFHPLGTVLLATALSGSVFGLILAIRHQRLRQLFSNALELVGHHQTNGLEPHPEINMRSANALRMPFALPIALGCLFALSTEIWGA